MRQELQRDVHKRQLLIDEEVKQSVECIKANAATGTGHILVWFTLCSPTVWKQGGQVGWHVTTKFCCQSFSQY